MGVSSNYFMELAKFRAARMLWAQIVEQYKPASADSAKMHVHAATSQFNQTIYDAHVNLLRSQTEAMSAALAGVDSITVVPFDTPYKTPDTFSERIARNQQFLLKEESHLDKVVDPAGGSYYVETLTVSIANEAWKLFLEVEEKGGFFAEVDNGDVQKAVNASCEKRHTDVARRKEILLGTNQYPNINEMAADKIENKECKCACGNEEKGENALLMKRAATDFEALRLATEAASNPKCSCSQSAIWPCVSHAPSSRPTSSVAPVMKSSTTSVLTPSRQASTQLLRKAQMSSSSAQATTNTQPSPPRPSNISTAALSLS